MTYISRSGDFSSFIFALKNILVLLAKLNSGELRCPATALILLLLSLKFAFLFLDFETVVKIFLPNSFMDKVCVFLVISLAFQLAIFSKIVIRFLYFFTTLPDFRTTIFGCGLYNQIPFPTPNSGPQNGGAAST